MGFLRSEPLLSFFVNLCHTDIQLKPIDISGHKTSLSNGAWESLYPATMNTAYVQVLINTGAIIVSKTNPNALFIILLARYLANGVN